MLTKRSPLSFLTCRIGSSGWLYVGYVCLHLCGRLMNASEHIFKRFARCPCRRRRVLTSCFPYAQHNDARKHRLVRCPRFIVFPLSLQPYLYMMPVGLSARSCVAWLEMRGDRWKCLFTVAASWHTIILLLRNAMVAICSWWSLSMGARSDGGNAMRAVRYFMYPERIEWSQPRRHLL